MGIVLIIEAGPVVMKRSWKVFCFIAAPLEKTVTDLIPYEAF